MDIGPAAALIAAFLWTCSSMIWGMINLPALTLNVCKNWIGVTLFGIQLAIVSFGFGLVEISADWQAWGWLGLSGLIGIVIGDTMYFRSLQILGPRRALVLACLGPFFAAVLGLMFLQQMMGYLVVLGVGLTMSGVLVVVMDRKAKQEEPGLMPGKIQAGIAFGVLAAACQAGGGLFSIKGMASCSPLEAAAIRLFVSAIATSLWILSRQKYRQAFKQAIKIEHLRYVVPATMLGTWLGIWFCQMAYKNNDLAIAQTLLSTCPLFAIPVMWILYRQRINRLAFCGTVVAIFGIWLTVKYQPPALQDSPNVENTSVDSTSDQLSYLNADSNTQVKFTKLTLSSRLG